MHNRLIAILFGILPDLFSFAPIFIYQFFTKVAFLDLIGRDIWVVHYASESYKYTHSIIIFGLAVLVVYLFRKFLHKSVLYWPMFGWALHILIDIPTHRGFYETPFLFPLSDYQFGYGVSWGTPWFMIINYSVLALSYVYWFLFLRRI